MTVSLNLRKLSVNACRFISTYGMYYLCWQQRILDQEEVVLYVAEEWVCCSRPARDTRKRCLRVGQLAPGMGLSPGMAASKTRHNLRVYYDSDISLVLVLVLVCIILWRKKTVASYPGSCGEEPGYEAKKTDPCEGDLQWLIRGIYTIMKSCMFRGLQCDYLFLIACSPHARIFHMKRCQYSAFDLAH